MVTHRMYLIVQNLKKNGVSSADIVRQTGLDWKTVKKYLSLTTEEFLKYQLEGQDRDKSFESFRDPILACYSRARNRKLHVSSVFDYLEEVHGDLPGNEQTLRNYIKHLQASDALNLAGSSRRYQSVPQLPPGQQLQVDFGQATMQSNLKLYLFAAVLSSSRFKIAFCQEKPFATLDVIRYLLDTFQEIGGSPKELVIDQDRLMVVSENYGDVLFTKDFEAFIQEQTLKMFVCRKADPESKGKVENLVGFIKKSFLDARDFSELSEARSSLRKWLFRRANGRRSAATGRVPAAALEEERSHLRPLRASIFQTEEFAERITRDVDKFGLVTIHGRKYQVPPEYRKKTVVVIETCERVVFQDPFSRKTIGTSKVPLFPGSTPEVATPRQPSGALAQLRRTTEETFPVPAWKEFLRRNLEQFPRYSRDQLGVFSRKIQGKFGDEVILQAITFCLDSDTVSMTDLVDTCRHFAQKAIPLLDQVAPIRLISCSPKRLSVTVACRSTKEYTEALEPQEVSI